MTWSSLLLFWVGPKALSRGGELWTLSPLEVKPRDPRPGADLFITRMKGKVWGAGAG